MSAVWECLCGATGSAETEFKTDVAAPDAKHLKACGQVVVVSTNPGALARMVATMRGEA